MHTYTHTHTHTPAVNASEQKLFAGFDDYQQTHIDVVAADGTVTLHSKADHEQVCPRFLC
jgi:hypothetical protein